MNKLYIFVIALIAIITTSCEQDIKTIDPANNELAGTWEVNALVLDNKVYGPFKINTALASNDIITIADEDGSFWDFQVKANVGSTGNSFTAKDAKCEISDPIIGINITNGKVVQGDSIYFEIQFENDEEPYEITYKLTGQRVD